MANNKKREKNSKEVNITNSGESSLSNRAFTVPNLLCLMRILLITPFVQLFLEERYGWAAIVIIASGLTDCFDGLIARLLHQESELGKILDPLADKLTLLAVGCCLVVIEPYFLPVVIILIAKDLVMLIGSSKVVKKGVIIPKSQWYGKLGTIMFYVTVTFIVLVKVVNTIEDPWIYIEEHTGMVISMVMLALTALIMIFALVMYFRTFLQIMRNAEGVQEQSGSITETE